MGSEVRRWEVKRRVWREETGENFEGWKWSGVE